MAGNALFMELALRQAARGRGRTSPNPMVGCVMVRRGEIVGTGYHDRAGAPHAEVVALREAGERAKGADVYVTLEPCSHHGRTGPCADALIAAGVRRVFVATRDPNPVVNGRGLRRLKKAKIEVEVGLLGDEARRLNEAFEHVMRRGRPFFVGKTAQSLDGRVATATGESKWITGPKARRRGHQLRAELDGILVGVGTVLADDPKLTCRVRGGRDPTRIILDTKARTPPKAQVVQVGSRSKAPTLIVVGPRAPNKQVAALERAGAEVQVLKSAGGMIDLEALAAALCERELLSVLVEGGPTVLGGFFDAGLVDKLHLFVSPKIIGGVKALSSVGARGIAALDDATWLEDLSVEALGPDLHVVGYPKR